MINSLTDFIKTSPTSFHAVKSICSVLDESGFIKLKENEKWNIKRNSKYYCVRNSSSVIAFTTGEINKFNIVASHSDSPCLKIKPVAEIKSEKSVVLNTECYGGLILSTWLDRPLTIAGRVMLESGNEITEKLIYIENPCLIIPNVAMHLNREINKGFEYNKKTDMCALFTGNKDRTLLSLIAEEIDCEENDILSYDLNVVSAVAPVTWGENDEFISSPRLDDLQCAYSSLMGFVASSSNAYNVYCCFDNEEVGSSTRQGAKSDFLRDVIERITSSLGLTREETIMALDDSFMLSADNAHAVHPNHPELSDCGNRCYMNDGIVIKENGNQKYMTDAYSLAKVKKLCKDNNIPWQVYVDRSDLAGGSTLGNLSVTQVSIKGADVGAAQLSMHSCFETAGNRDTDYLTQLFTAFYNS